MKRKSYKTQIENIYNFRIFDTRHYQPLHHESTETGEISLQSRIGNSHHTCFGYTTKYSLLRQSIWSLNNHYLIFLDFISLSKLEIQQRQQMGSPVCILSAYIYN